MTERDEFRQVTCDEFYKSITPQDVQVSTRGVYRDADYGSDFTLKSGKLVGFTRSRGVNPEWKPERDYFLPPQS